MNTYEQKLRSRYEDLYQCDIPETDTWVLAPPAIPFVGDNYGQHGRCKVLLYGSAENLTYLARLPQDRTIAEAPIDRNRKLFQQWKSGTLGKERKSIDNWFPWVHMTPISDGTLLTVARYLLHMFRNDECFSDDPTEFLHQIAVVNYGKFSLNKNSNEDYASAQPLLDISKTYVQSDLETLSADVVIMPRTIHMHGLKPILQDRSERPEVWRIYQTNSGVINRTIKKQLPADHERFSKERPKWLKPWLGHIPKAVQMDSYMNWLDWKIATGDGTAKDRWPIVFE